MEENKDKKQGVPLTHAWTALLVFYVVALALNAAALHRNNERLPYGPVRSFWVAVFAPFCAVFQALHADRPRAVLEKTVGASLNKN